MICFACQYAFGNNELLIRHVRICHAQLSVFRCYEEFCQRSFSSFVSFKSHRKAKHDDKAKNFKKPVSKQSSDHAMRTEAGNDKDSADISQKENSDCHIDEDDVFFNESPDEIDDAFITQRLKYSQGTDDYPGITDGSLNLAESIKERSLRLIATLYSFPEISRNRVQDIIDLTSTFVSDIVTTLRTNLENHVKPATDDYENLNAIKNIYDIFSDPFNDLQSEFQCFSNFVRRNSLVLPENRVIGERDEFRKDESQILKFTKVNLQFIPMRLVFKQFLELPNLLQETLEYMDSLKSDTEVISNFCQGSLWKTESSSFGQDIVLPLFLYFDDYEVNNPLGSHKGISKCGAVYLSLPSLPPRFQSKIENIFLFILFNCLDREQFKNEIIFARAMEELQFLRNTGITVNLPTGSVKVFFQLALILGDNLGIHSILGLTEGFNANFFCRFCLIKRTELSTIFQESQCELRNTDNYESLLQLGDASQSGIKERCVFHKIKEFHIAKNLCVDAMHDLLEGVCQYDLALIFHHYIYILKLFTLEELNVRLQAFTYTDNYNRNKPAEILAHHLKKNKCLSMSASETLTMIRHICMVLGPLVDADDEHWQMLKLLKIITEIVRSPVLHKNSHIYLGSNITAYLQYHAKLFPNSMKPKHHFLVHYPRVLESVGVLWKISSMRYEAKHGQEKVIARSAINRINVCHTIALRHQLILNDRFLNKRTSYDNYKCGPKKEIVLHEELEAISCKGLTFSEEPDLLRKTSWILLRGDRVTKNSILVIPDTEGPVFFDVQLIVSDAKNEVLFICRKLLDCFFDDHTQSFKIINLQAVEWVCVKYEDLGSASISTKNILSDGFTYISKLIL